MAGGDPGKLVNGGFQPVFSRDEEDQLRRYLLDASEIFLGLSISELRSLAYDLALESKKKHPFSRKNQKAGYEWVRNFFRRNPEVSIRAPQATSFYRARGFSPEKVKIFFDNLKIVYDRHTYQPAQIFNMDETGFSSVMDQVKVIARRGAKQVGRITSGEKGQLVTAVYCCNANGDYIPPMLILPGKKFKPELIEDAPENTIGTCTPSGWSNQETFYSWLQHFAEHSNASSRNPILLILDNSRTHLKADAIDFCRTRSITMLSLPPHTSHRLQPLDVSVFKPMKMCLKVAEQAWMSQHVPRVITRKELPLLFKQAYEASATRNNAQSGFRKSGIWPFNPNIFTDADFAPSVPFQCCPDEALDDENDMDGNRQANGRENAPADVLEDMPAMYANGPAVINLNVPAVHDAYERADDDIIMPVYEDVRMETSDASMEAQYVNMDNREGNMRARDENMQASAVIMQVYGQNMQASSVDKYADAHDVIIEVNYVNMPASDPNMKAIDANMKPNDANIKPNSVNMPADDENMQAYDVNMNDYDDNMKAHDAKMNASDDNMNDNDDNMNTKDDNMQAEDGGESGPAEEFGNMRANREESEPADDFAIAGANFLRLISEPRNEDESLEPHQDSSKISYVNSPQTQLTRRRSPRCHPTPMASPYKVRPLPKANSYKSRKGGRPPMLSRILTDPEKDPPPSKPKKQKKPKKK